MHLPYTICFIWRRIYGQDQILMLHRKREPHIGQWNGVGGKIKSGETPYECIAREVREETGLHLSIHRFRFAGIVTWVYSEGDVDNREGMFVFTAQINDMCDLVGTPVLYQVAEREEGTLAWLETKALCRRNAPGIVSNIPFFLPHILAELEPQEYRCWYDSDGFLADVTIHDLPDIQDLVIRVRDRASTPSP